MKKTKKVKIYVKEKIMKKNEVKFVPSGFSAYLLDLPVALMLSEVAVRCPCLACGTLFKATSNPQFVAVSSRLGCT